MTIDPAAQSKKIVTNLVIVTLVLTVIGAGMSSIGLSVAFAFLTIGMLPGIVANITDRRPGRFASKTVTAFNLAGISPHLTALLASGSPNNTAISIFADPRAWLLVYGSAAFGWGVIYIVPRIAQLYFEIRANFIVRKLAHFQQALVSEWGEKVKE